VSNKGNITGAVPATLPRDAAVQLATLAASCPEGQEWVHEIKLDGYRLLATVHAGETRLTSRNGNDWTTRFGALATSLAKLSCKAAILDGEAVILNEAGVSSFQKLQNALGRDQVGNVVYFAFDLLFLDGLDLRPCTLIHRKELLQKLLDKNVTPQSIRFSDHVRGGGATFNAEACRMGLEGTICKRADAPYTAGRSRSWIKVKCLQRQEFVIVGFTDPSGVRKGLGALLLGVYDGDKLLYCGKVGTGFSTKTLDELYETLLPLQRVKPAVVNPPLGAAAKGIHWVAAKKVAEVSFAEWTEDGAVRHASFQGLRGDKNADEVVRERPIQEVATTKKKVTKATDPVVAGIRISHPNKLLFADVGVNKLDLALYFEKVAPLAVAYLRARPLTLLRCPDGFEKGCFFQKHGNANVPKEILRVTVNETGEGSKEYLMVDALPSIILLVQMGVVEFHVWGSRFPKIELPDVVVFDLDPGPAAEWKDVAITALALRERLAELGLAAYPRFTGGKGIHVVVPLTPRASWADVKSFSLALAQEFVRKAPRSFTIKFAKSGRESKILIDYLRNGRNATAVASYSPRARPGAPVALPVPWEEIEARTSGPLLLSVIQAPAWLEKMGDDPWKGFDGARRTLTKKILTDVGVR